VTLSTANLTSLQGAATRQI